MASAVPIRRAAPRSSPSVPPACYIGMSYCDRMQNSSASNVVRLLLSLTRIRRLLQQHIQRATSHVQPARCTPGELRLAQVVLSPMTGEHGSFYKLVNPGRRACTLDGARRSGYARTASPCRCATPAAAACT